MASSNHRITTLLSGVAKGRDYNINNNDADKRDDIDWLTIGRNVVRNWRLCVMVTAGFCVMGAIYLLISTAQYRADALLRLQNAPAPSLSALSGVSATLSSERSTSDQTDMLKSRAIIEQAIVTTQADIVVKVDNYFPVIGRFWANRYNAKVDKTGMAGELAKPVLWMSHYPWGGERLKVGAFNLPNDALGKKFTVTAGPAGQWLLYNDRHVLLARGVVGKTSTFPIVSFNGQREAGQLRINEMQARPGVTFTLSRLPLQEVYNAVVDRLKTSVSNSDSPLVASSLIRLSYQADTAVAAQSMVNAIVQAYLQLDVTLRAKQAKHSMDFLFSRLPQLKRDLDTAEDRLNAYRAKTHIVDINQQNAALVARISSLQERKSTLEQLLAQRKQSFMPDNPAYRSTQAELAQVQQELRVAQAREVQMPSEQGEYIRLERAVTVSSQLYTSVLANAQQLEVAAASTAPGISVIDWAMRADRPAWPHHGIVMLGALFGGLFLSMLIVYLKTRFYQQFALPQELDSISELPRLAVITQSAEQGGHDRRTRQYLHAPSRLLAVANPMDPSIESLRTLRSSLRAILASPENRNGHRKITITGPTRGVGKSFVASNFAYLLSERGASVLLIDADMRQGALARLLPSDGVKFRSRIGLADVLQGLVSADEAIVELGVNGLSLLSAGFLGEACPSELLGRADFGELISDLSKRYDYIVIDSPPVLPVSDALLIAEHSDMVLLVSRAELTNARQLKEAQQRLDQAGAHIGGHIFNGFSPTRYGEYDEYSMQY